MAFVMPEAHQNRSAPFDFPCYFHILLHYIYIIIIHIITVYIYISIFIYLFVYLSIYVVIYFHYVVCLFLEVSWESSRIVSKYISTSAPAYTHTYSAHTYTQMHARNIRVYLVLTHFT
jgi:hypothetical protein